MVLFIKNIQNTRTGHYLSNMFCNLCLFSKNNKYENNNKDTPICVIDYKETIPFIPNIDSAYIIKVYDGDTITIASKLPYPDSPLYRFQVRLRGIDCPEIKSKSEDERKMADFAKKEMEDLVFQKKVILRNLGTEKYGRLLADVYINNIYLNEHMLNRRLAVKYDGGKKTCPLNCNFCISTGPKY